MSRHRTTPMSWTPSGASALALSFGGAGSWIAGAWQELIPATTASGTALAAIHLGTSSYAGQEFELEFALGPVSGEVIYARQRIYGPTSANLPHDTYCLETPVAGIPLGSRISARVRETGVTALTLGLGFYQNLDAGHQSTQFLSSVPTGADGVSVTPSGVALAWSGWHEITPALAGDVDVYGLAAQNAIANTEYWWQVATGAAGAESILTEWRHATQNASAGQWTNHHLPAGVPVASGTRLAIRVRKTGTATTAHKVAILTRGSEPAEPVPPTPATDDLCGSIDDPLMFASFDLDGLRRWAAVVALDDPETYYNGYKDDRLLNVSEIHRALAGSNLDYQVGTFSLELADEDYAIRSILASPSGQVFRGRECEVYWITPSGRRAEREALKIATGFTDADPSFDDAPEAMSVRLMCRDRIGAVLGWTAAGQAKVPRRVLTPAMLPGLSASLVGYAAPWIYGRASSAVSTSGTPPVPSGLGAWCAFELAGYWAAGFGHLPNPPAPPSSVAATAQAGGSLSLETGPHYASTYFVHVYPVTAAGVVGDPAPFCPDGVSAVVSSGTQTVRATWAASPDAARYYVMLGTKYNNDVDWHQYVVASGLEATFTANPAFGAPVTVAEITPGAVIPQDGLIAYYQIRSKYADGVRSPFNPLEVQGIANPTLPNGRVRPMRVSWIPTGAPDYEVQRRWPGGTWDRQWTVSSGSLISGLVVFDDDWLDTGAVFIGAPARPAGNVEATYTRDVILSDGMTWREFLIGGTAIKGVEAGGWYFDDGTNPVEIGQGDGIDFLVPVVGGAWFDYFSTIYRDITGTDGVTRRFTLAYARGPKGDALAGGTTAGSGTGSARLTVNCEGITAAGDGSGAVITDLHDQWVHLMQNVVLSSGEGYTTGEWAGMPVFSRDGLDVIDLTSVAALKAMRASELVGGLPGAGVVGRGGTQIGVTDEIKRWAVCGDFRIGTNRLWQIGIYALNHSLTASGLERLTDQFDIHTRTFKAAPRLAELTNVFKYRAQPNATGGWDADNQELIVQPSIDRWGIRQESEVLEFHYVPDPTARTFILERRADRQSEVPYYVTLEGSLCLTEAAFDVGRYVKLDHWRGLAMSGWVGRPLWILSHMINPDTKRVRLECLDVTHLVPSGVAG